MMSSETCTKCGAEMLAGAKFCRRCGAPSRAFERSSVTEAETRVFQAPDDRSAQTQYHDPRPTGPSYLAPNESAFPNQPFTTVLAPARVKRHGILWASAILFVLLLMFGGVLALKWSRTPSTAPITKSEVAPQTGVAPPVAPEAPQPPQPPAVKKGNGSGLIYPGAVVTMAMTRGAEGSVRTLRTKDPVDMVIAWYTEKLKPAKTIRTADSAVLNGNNATAVITSDDGETSVVLKEGIDQ